MAEHPILFKGPMVRAILSGSKTQTRRVVNFRRGTEPSVYWRAGEFSDETRCPYGVPGDTLWVREPLRPLRHISHEDVIYEADARFVIRDGKRAEWMWKARNISSRFCPRWACRLRLHVTEVRVERLQAITEEDAREEGASCESALAWSDAVGAPDPYAAAVAMGYRAGFRELWDGINGKRPGCSWADDPWVWVIGFEKL